MIRRSTTMWGAIATGALLARIGLPAAAGAAPKPKGPVVYSALPSTLPSSVPSIGHEATSTNEFGDAVQLVTQPGAVIRTVNVVMVSWGCESGTWWAGTCSTTPGATFDHPLTLNLYEVGSPTPGPLLASVTQTFSIPYRPSADPDCTGGRWQDANGDCFNGYATTVSFDLGAGVAVPSEVIWSVAYNTSHHGYAPIGNAPCTATSGGCGYDSLNVGAEDFPTKGTDLDPDGAYLNSTWAGAYCDGGAGGVGVFREDTSPGCWAGYRPLAELVSATKKDCKHDGWKTFTDPVFTNQGQCVKYFEQVFKKPKK